MIESTLTEFGDDTELGDDVGTSEGRAILQKDLDRLEGWASSWFSRCYCTRRQVISPRLPFAWKVRPDDLLMPLPTWTILYFYEKQIRESLGQEKMLLIIKELKLVLWH